MMFLLLVAFLFAHRVASEEVPLTAWYSAPNFRGTWDLILSCVLTLTICVWSALHLNVPTEDSRLRERNTRRFRWILLGIFAPELVVSTAFAQYLTARWLRREILKDVKHRKQEVRCWKVQVLMLVVGLTFAGHQSGLELRAATSKMEYHTMLLCGYGR